MTALMTPSQYYRQQVDSGIITRDARQEAVLLLFNTLFTELNHLYHHKKKRWHKLIGRVLPPTMIKGLYLWGDVGVGKTFLMDIFFHCLQVPKRRDHFHQFMQEIHEALANVQGKKNPLEYIATEIAEKTKVLCFDEFMVTNIADALILGGLFKALFAKGVALIASSNSPPDELYRNGLQRERFLPTIELLKEHTTIFHLQGQHDYRLRPQLPAQLYFSPLNESAELALEQSFQHFSQGLLISTEPIELFSRTIQIRKQAGDVIWFDFMALCGIPRSPKDFLALTKRYRTLIISNIPMIKPNQYNLITNFINLIDILYDTRTRVIISAEVSIDQLYPEGVSRQAFARTRSRLIEMQSFRAT